MTEDLIHYCIEHEKVWCYGAGLYGRHTAIFLAGRGIKIEGFIVSEADGAGVVLDKEVHQLSDMGDSIAGLGLIICVGKNSFEDVSTLLAGHGITDYFKVIPEMLTEMELCNRGENLWKFVPDTPLNPVVCIYYHRVAELDSDPWKMAVTPQEFEWHLKYLKENYNVVKFDYDWTQVTNGSVVLTFDDGYYDFYLNAYPLLQKYEIPATVFVSTANIGTKREFWWDRLERILWHSAKIPDQIKVSDDYISCRTDEEIKESLSEIRIRLKEDYTHEMRWEFLDELEQKCAGTREMRIEDRTMNEEELREISESDFVTVGAHTMTHPALALQKPDICRKEIVGSGKQLEKIINKKVDMFSYPFGNYDGRTANMVREAGYLRSRTITPGIITGKTDPMEIPAENAGAMSCEELADYLALTWIFKGDAKF